MTNTLKNFDALVIGGGFYGCMLALFLKTQLKSVAIVEKESQILTKASYNNQARIHNGYHYPRSHITALSSHANFLRFIKEFNTAVVNKFPSFYGIARQNSKVTAAQFRLFCLKIGMPLKKAPQDLKELFNSHLIEDLFQVQEYEFSGTNLRHLLLKKIKQSDVKIFYNHPVYSVSSSPKNTINVHFKQKSTLNGKQVFNCTYSQINTILKNSHLPLLPLKFENTQMPLLKLPTPLHKYGFTIMDGPFFSLLPFPDRKMHSLHHVRYTPLKSWRGTCDEEKQFIKPESNFSYMIKDISRYIPLLKNQDSTDSIYQTKTVLEINENNDGRPILFKKNYQIPNFHIVLGGKIDNVFDIIDEIKNQGL